MFPEGVLFNDPLEYSQGRYRNTVSDERRWVLSDYREEVPLFSQKSEVRTWTGMHQWVRTCLVIADRVCQVTTGRQVVLCVRKSRRDS